MKWFKHDANASIDSKLKRLRLKYGMEGYGLYWYCLECIAKNVESHNLTFELEEDSELISADTNIHRERVQEMMAFMVDAGLFENRDGSITCLKMATRTDEYTQKLMKNIKSVPTVSRHDPDNVRLNRREEKRIEEKLPTNSFCKKKEGRLDLGVPEGVDSGAWKMLVEHKKAMKAPMATQHAISLNANKLRQLSVKDQVAMVEQSVENGWKGLYDLKQKQQQNRRVKL